MDFKLFKNKINKYIRVKTYALTKVLFQVMVLCVGGR
jgi:hypothetical protein